MYTPGVAPALDLVQKGLVDLGRAAFAGRALDVFVEGFFEDRLARKYRQFRPSVRRSWCT